MALLPSGVKQTEYIMSISHDECRHQYLKELNNAGISCPKDIVEYLDQYVMGQDEAKKAAAVMVWNHLHGIKTNNLFIGPSGSGKTHIWRSLKKIPLFSHIISIHDASEITQKGWKGHIKSDTALGELYFGKMSGLDKMLPYAETCIIVYDEFDKLVSPAHSSSGENVSYSIQSQFLTMVEGADIRVKNPEPRMGEDEFVTMDTRDISFAFCGAFEELYKKRHKIETTTTMGFAGEDKPKIEPITIEDIIEYGTRPELAGRIAHISTLEPLTKDQIISIITGKDTSPVVRYVMSYGIEVSITKEYAADLADRAINSSMGVRIIGTMIDEDMSKVIYKVSDNSYDKIHVTLHVDHHGNRIPYIKQMHDTCEEIEFN